MAETISYDTADGGQFSISSKSKSYSRGADNLRYSLGVSDDLKKSQRKFNKIMTDSCKINDFGFIQ